MSFAPGELSTIHGFWKWKNRPVDGETTAPPFDQRPFNPAHLPCPPKSVMLENWWKPISGHPYQPIIANPKRFSSLHTYFTDCSGLFFSALDPPIALTAESLAPSDDPSDTQLNRPNSLTSAGISSPSETPPPAPGSAVGEPPAATGTPYSTSLTSTAPSQAELHSDDGSDGKSVLQMSTPTNVETEGPYQQHSVADPQPGSGTRPSSPTVQDIKPEEYKDQDAKGFRDPKKIDSSATGADASQQKQGDTIELHGEAPTPPPTSLTTNSVGKENSFSDLTLRMSMMAKRNKNIVRPNTILAQKVSSLRQ